MKHIITYLLAVTITLIFISCSDNTVNNPGSPSSTYPKINIKVGSSYRFTNDSLITDSTRKRTSKITTDTVISKGTFFSQADAFMIGATTKDTVTNTILNVETFYVKFDTTAGKYYQYGAVRLLDSTQTATWDPVADFSVPTGTEWAIATINNVLGYSGTSAVIKSKVAKDTSFTCTGSGGTIINAYRIEMTAAVSFGGFPVGKIILEYYIGYTPSGSSNPSGTVRLKLRPINLSIVSFPGFDQILQTWQIP
jgi:hypothetical protein